MSLDETEIKAPFDGVITEKYVEEGSMISNGTPLVAVQDPTDNWVDIKVPETQLARFALGQEITLVGRDGETKVTGTITDISKKAEFATQRATSERGDATDIVSFNVKIQIDSPLLRPSRAPRGRMCVQDMADHVREDGRLLAARHAVVRPRRRRRDAGRACSSPASSSR